MRRYTRVMAAVAVLGLGIWMVGVASAGNVTSGVNTSARGSAFAPIGTVGPAVTWPLEAFTVNARGNQIVVSKSAPA